MGTLTRRFGTLCLLSALLLGSCKAEFCSVSSPNNCAGTDQIELLQKQVSVAATTSEEESVAGASDGESLASLGAVNDFEQDSDEIEEIGVAEDFDDRLEDHDEEDLGLTDIACADFANESSCHASGCTWSVDTCELDEANDDDTNIDCGSFQTQSHCQASGCSWKGDACEEDASQTGDALLQDGVPVAIQKHEHETDIENADVQVMPQSEVGVKIEGTKDELAAENANTDHGNYDNDEHVLKQGLEEDDESEMDGDEEEDEDNESEDYAPDQENAEEESGGTGGNEEQEMNVDMQVVTSNMNITGIASSGGSSGATSVQSVKAVHSGGFLSIRFRHEDQEYDYKVLPRSVYAADAEVYNGSELLEVGPPTTYRAHGEHGKWAAISLHSDGSVQGLFLHENRLLQVTPAQDMDGAELPQFDGPLAAMLEGFSGPGAPHLVQWLDKSAVLLELGIQQPVEVDETKDGASPMTDVGAGARAEEEAEVQGVNAWGGTKWAGKGECYKGDEEMHEMTLGIYVDKEARKRAKKYLGKSIRTQIEGYANQASFIFEMQMHFAFKIATLKLDFFGKCKSTWKTRIDLHERLKDLSWLSGKGKLKFRAINHVISGFTGIGVAYKGTFCRKIWNSGVTGYRAGWRVFAHEIGHQLGGRHSFENGKRSTGGIMDYGGGKWNGHYQFHQLRKEEICRRLNNTVDKCQGNFQKESGPSRRRTPSKVVGTAPTDEEIRELKEINTLTGGNWTLEGGRVCVKKFKRAWGVSAKKCALLCKKQEGCREFSFGGFGPRGTTQCRYAEDGWGCCKYLKESLESPEWKEQHCVPGGEGIRAACSMGNCRHYTMNTVTTAATLWRQYVTGLTPVRSWKREKRGFRCNKLKKNARSKEIRVANREACQDFAIKNGHKYYRFFNHEPWQNRVCQSYRKCKTVRWVFFLGSKIFAEEDPKLVESCSLRRTCTLKKDPNPPTMPPTEPPTEPPTKPPTQAPTEPPTNSATEPPTNSPTESPTKPPTEPPTQPPTTTTEAPTNSPTEAPTNSPTESPTKPPTELSTQPPTTTEETSSSFTKLAGKACGGGSKCGKKKNRLNIGQNSRHFDTVKGPEEIEIKCFERCARFAECGGFMYNRPSKKCLYRKNAKCNVKNRSSRDCYQKNP